MGKVSKWTISTAMNCLLEGCYIPSTSFHHLPFETNGFATQGSSRPSNLPRRPHTMQSQTRNLGSSKGWAGLGTLHSSNLTVSIYIMRKSEPGHAGPSIFSANSGRLANWIPINKLSFSNNYSDNLWHRPFDLPKPFSSSLLAQVTQEHPCPDLPTWDRPWGAPLRPENIVIPCHSLDIF
jgi:hypothetical protein